MKPSELAKLRFTGKLPSHDLPSPVELEGTLIASGNFSHLIDADTPDYSPEPCFGVLLPEGLIERLSHLPIPLLGGSSVNFVGHATFVCDVWQTGYPALPYRMTEVYSFSYEDKYVGKNTFHVSHMAYDVYVNADRSWDAYRLKSLLPYFEGKFTIMGLRTHLQGNGVVLLHRALKGTQLSEAEDVLTKLGVRYELRRVPKGIDWLEQYKDEVSN